MTREFRNIECTDALSSKAATGATGAGAIDAGGSSGGSGWRDVSSSIGNRRVQLEKLTEKYRGRIDTDVMKRILADHYDNHLGKTAANTRTVCKHGYSDDGSGFRLRSLQAGWRVRHKNRGFFIGETNVVFSTLGAAVWDAVFSEGAYEETPGVERLGGIFSGFPEEGVGGGVE